MSGDAEIHALHELSRRSGVQTSYRDQSGAERIARPEALVAVLAALGHDVGSPADASGLLRDLEASGPALTTDAALATWGREPARLEIVIPAADAAETPVIRDAGAPMNVRTVQTAPAGDHARVLLEVAVDAPPGVHAVALEIGGHRVSLSVLATPARAPGFGDGRRTLGVFAPLYALHGDRHREIGDLRDLWTLARWAADAGAPFAGTLPLLATFLDEPFDPTPYAPVSRLLWNELYADLAASPDLEHAPEAARLLARTPDGPLETCGDGTLVDYRRVWTHRRAVIEHLAEATFAHPRRREELERWVTGHPHVADYAAFRAAGDVHRCTWDRWPAATRDGRIDIADVPPARYHAHLYGQWLMETQLERLAADLGGRGGGLYLDLPVGVHARGYDAWRYRDQFLDGLSVGAPPDKLFTGGQDWGFPPADPRAGARNGHALFQAVARHHVRHAAVLRVDHVMGLHRVYCVPHGMDATDGVYLRQPGAELYAALCIEAHQHGTVLVGENLGTVPPETHEMLATRGILGMDVAQFALRVDGDEALPAPPPGTLACVNTHDLPTFAGYWRGRDLAILTRAGVFDETQRRVTQRHRGREWVHLVEDLTRRGLLASGDRDLRSVLAATLRLLADSRADMLVINVEDLWQETEPQNVPGPGSLYPSWRRRTRRTLEAITGDAEITTLLRELATRRG